MSVNFNSNLDLNALNGVEAAEETTATAATAEAVSEEAQAIEDARTNENEQVEVDFSEDVNEFGLDQSSLDAMKDGIYASPADDLKDIGSSIGDALSNIGRTAISAAKVTASLIASITSWIADCAGDYASNIHSLKDYIMTGDFVSYLGRELAEELTQEIINAIEPLVNDAKVGAQVIIDAASNVVSGFISGMSQ